VPIKTKEDAVASPRKKSDAEELFLRLQLFHNFFHQFRLEPLHHAMDSLCDGVVVFLACLSCDGGSSLWYCGFNTSRNGG
jgi:hypothetical protein